MVKLNLSRPLSLVKTPTLENLQEVPDHVGSPQKTKRKTINVTYLPPSEESLTNKIISIPQAIKQWMIGQKEKLKTEYNENDKPVEWGYFVDLESVVKQNYWRNKFNKKIPIYEQLPVFMVIPNPWRLETIKEKNSNLDSELESEYNNDFEEKWNRYGLLYTLVSFAQSDGKNRSKATILLLSAIGLLSLTLGAYSVCMLNNITYGLHKQVSE